MVRLYPWDLWFGERRFKVRRGRDYLCGAHSMAQQIRNAASKRRVNVTIVESKRGDLTVTVQENHAN